MKKFLLSIMALGLGATLHAQTRADYDETVNKFQQYYNGNMPDSIFNMFGARLQQMVTIDKTREMLKQLTAQVGKMDSYEFTKEEKPFSYYKASFANAPLSLILMLSKEHKLESFRIVPYDANPAPKEKSNFVYKAPTGNIYGTLAVPATDKKVPVVLIIAGSGPTDRNGNQANISPNCYKMIADSLQKEGIASLRYDKRGIGESKGAIKDEESTRFDDMADDAAGIVKMLKADTRFSKIIILGHSEGSLVGMVAAAKEKVNGFISLAGAGERANKILERQLSTQSKEEGAQARLVMDSIMNGYTIKNRDSSSELFRPSVQPYLRSWFQHDPQTEIKKLAVPILILQGTTDIQVSEHDAQLLKKANPKAKLQLVNGMNHILKDAPLDRQQNIATYQNPSLPLSAGLMPAIYTFISGVK